VRGRARQLCGDRPGADDRPQCCGGGGWRGAGGWLQVRRQSRRHDAAADLYVDTTGSGVLCAACGMGFCRHGWLLACQPELLRPEA